MASLDCFSYAGHGNRDSLGSAQVRKSGLARFTEGSSDQESGSYVRIPFMALAGIKAEQEAAGKE